MKRMLKTGISFIAVAAGFILIVIGICAITVIADKLTALFVISLGIILIIIIIVPKFKFYKNDWIRRVHKVLTILIILFFIVLLIISSFMAFGINRFKEESFDGTVIVLGAKVNGNSPSQLLKSRLDEAVDIIENNPDCTCIVSGGQGKDETYTEASVMKQYLIDKGIDSTRIYTEENAINTQQNIEYTSDLIENEKLSSDVIVITNYFHSYRAQLFANHFGLNACSLPGIGRVDLEILYWFREIVAVAKAWLIIS